MLFPSILLPLLPLVSAGVSQWPPSSLQTIYNNLGNLAPYHAAPTVPGIQADLPDDCTIDQLMLMGRHGNRFPLSSELPYIQGLVAQLANASAAIQKARLPSNLAFLKSGYTTSLGTNDLTAPGRQTLFDHGVAFRLKYPALLGTSILAGAQDRVIESAQWFANGYFGRAWAGLNATAFSTIGENSSTVSWITAMDDCALWDYDYGGNATAEWGTVYLPHITKRLNAAVPGLGLTDDDTHGALYACAYDLAAWGTSPWCGAFTEQELASFEYELDLLMDGAFGYGLPGKMGPTIGALFTNSTGNASSVYLEFGHDTTIDNALTGLGLAKDVPYLPVRGPIPASRKWRTSNQVPFGAQMIWERFTCASSAAFPAGQPQIRLVLNEAPFPLATCAQSRGDRAHGTCSVANFAKANAASAAVGYGNAVWNAACAANATVA
ncbi:phosphoglycerate mutase-like protein [Athelia psychrophila]|uniref:Phosphoglycerate mutase-like protein n=1 Tax=Athelia psychrophila TaxID=1759441 RepID=A0A166S1J1_9AGAM|nr:phosphoglycerate mutase-like protein [Fibularhizoctonia sp. CBS 109695]